MDKGSGLSSPHCMKHTLPSITTARLPSTRYQLSTFLTIIQMTLLLVLYSTSSLITYVNNNTTIGHRKHMTRTPISPYLTLSLTLSPTYASTLKAVRRMRTRTMDSLLSIRLMLSWNIPRYPSLSSPITRTIPTPSLLQRRHIRIICSK